ncbi:10189_t:CDS:2 [Ambispora gerdemannii]|uniref:10189_t:CDS:1 n=1 Tax=Ambispora gerdemannii TaxID=144530 RepID=A0A9N9CCU2_9GLOM|nr:10189_t:CDS:2 [Ambispora gerdemannii]
MQKCYSVEIGDAAPGQGRTRSPFYPKLDVKTVKTWETKKSAMGYRKILNIIEEEKEVIKTVNGVGTKKWKYFQLSEYHWYNYEEVGEITKNTGVGFIKLGLKRDSKVTVYAATR